MALLGNYSVLHKSPAKYLTGTIGFGDRSNFNKPGMMRNRGDSALWRYDAQPSGTYAGRAYFSPVKAGRLVSRMSFAVNAAATGAAGLPASAVAAFAVNAYAVGGLIAGGVATAAFTINATGAISGLAAGRASAALRILASGNLGASAFGVARSTISVSAFGQPYALGFMRATTADTSTLTPTGIASAVWSATAAANNIAGSMGQKLNSAASGGVDYPSMAAAVRADLQAELLRIVELAKLHGLVVGSDLVVTATSRTAGTVAQTITTSAGTTTVQRVP